MRLFHPKQHIHDMLLSSKDKFRLKVEQINGSSNYMLVSILSDDPELDKLSLEQIQRRQHLASYDPKGAGIYVSAVIFIWGLCIALLIASTIRKNRMDKTISLYLKEIQSIRHNSDKQKILKLMPIDKGNTKFKTANNVHGKHNDPLISLPNASSFKLFKLPSSSSTSSSKKQPMVIPKICIDKEIDEDNRSAESSESLDRQQNKADPSHNTNSGPSVIVTSSEEKC